MKRQSLFFCLTVMLAVCFTVSAYSKEGAAGTNSDVLQIQEQGSFAAGGTVIAAPGIFDPKQPANPQGQTLHGDHAY